MASIAKRIALEARQYGFFPMRRLMSAGPGLGVLVNSVPKSGTNLLLRALYLHPLFFRVLRKTVTNDAVGSLPRLIDSSRRNQFLSCHLYYSSELSELLTERGVPRLIMVRDPGDVALSAVNYMTEIDDRHPMRAHLAKLPAFSDRLRLVLNGVPVDFTSDVRTPENLGIAKHIDRYLGWLDDDCLLVRYETLVGEKGGGSRADQIDELMRIYEHIRAPLNVSQVEEIANLLYSTASRTYKRGTIGRWRLELSENDQSLIKCSLSECASALGYDWSAREVV